MSHFYGTIDGGRGAQATKTATKQTGIVTYAASWSGSIRVELSHDEATGRDTFHVSQERWKGHGVSQLIARGEVGEESIAGEGSALIRDLWTALQAQDPQFCGVTKAGAALAERVKAMVGSN